MTGVEQERRSPARREATTLGALASRRRFSGQGQNAGETPALPAMTRSALARERAAAAHAALANCRLCAHDCGVNRLAGEHGLCHAGAEAAIFFRAS